MVQTIGNYRSDFAKQLTNPQFSLTQSATCTFLWWFDGWWFLHEVLKLVRLHPQSVFWSFWVRCFRRTAPTDSKYIHSFFGGPDLLICSLVDLSSTSTWTHTPSRIDNLEDCHKNFFLVPCQKCITYKKKCVSTSYFFTKDDHMELHCSGVRVNPCCASDAAISFHDGFFFFAFTICSSIALRASINFTVSSDLCAKL